MRKCSTGKISKKHNLLFNNYRMLSKDKTYITVLSKVEKDPHQFNGKSRKEILLSIGP